MEKHYSLLSRIFVVLALVSFIVAIIDKIFGFVIWGLFPLSYLRFTGVCLLFVIAFSLSQMAAKKK